MKRTQDTLEIKKLEETASENTKNVLSGDSDSSTQKPDAELLSSFPSPPLDLSSTYKTSFSSSSTVLCPNTVESTDLLNDSSQTTDNVSLSPNAKKMKLTEEEFDRTSSQKFILLSKFLNKKSDTQINDIFSKELNSCFMSPESEAGCSNSLPAESSQVSHSSKDFTPEEKTSSLQNIPHSLIEEMTSPRSFVLSPTSISSPEDPSSFSSASTPSNLPDDKLWPEYEEKDLSDLISLLVSGHKDLVLDCNSLSDEYFAQKFKECAVSCFNW